MSSARRLKASFAIELNSRQTHTKVKEMKEEVRRIIKMVEDGKITSHDATELIEAIEDMHSHEANTKQAQDSQEPGKNPSQEEQIGSNKQGSGTQTEHKDPFRSIIDVIENFGKEATGSKEWKDLTGKVSAAAQKGIEGVRDVVKDLGDGSFRFFNSGERREIHLPLSVPAGKRLRVENSCGNIHLRGGSDASEVVAKVEFRTGTTDVTAKEMASSYTLVVDESDVEVLIRQEFVENATINLELYVPGAVECTLQSMSGKLTAQGIGGIRGVTRSGSISVIECSGELELVTVSGDVRVRNTLGDRVWRQTK